MILSVSRRTDIPCYYSEWFLRRLKEGFLYVRNPMNLRQVSRIELSPETVDCIVFWTKNPAPMLDRLQELEGYPYYFQFTLTGYGRDVEPNVPDKKEIMIPVFQELSQKIGAERVVWRYDPILFTDKYTPEYHLKAFSQIAEALEGCTEKCVISFVDFYGKIQKNMNRLNVRELSSAELIDFAGRLSEIAKAHHMKIGSCAEKMDLEQWGIEHNSCIDAQLIEKIIGCKITGSKDKNQRLECGCLESVEVGTYNTCKNGCLYCYANHSRESMIANCAKYNPDSPLLCGEIAENDKITTRKVKSLREGQLSFTELT